MTKSDLIKLLSHQFPGITKNDSRQIIDLFLEDMKDGLKTGDTIEMRDFGVLRVRTRESRKARNPRTGEKVVVNSKKVPYFKQSQILKGRLNKNFSPNPNKYCYKSCANFISITWQILFYSLFKRRRS